MDKLERFKQIKSKEHENTFIMDFMKHKQKLYEIQIRNYNNKQNDLLKTVFLFVKDLNRFYMSLGLLNGYGINIKNYISIRSHNKKNEERYLLNKIDKETYMDYYLYLYQKFNSFISCDFKVIETDLNSIISK